MSQVRAVCRSLNGMVENRERNMRDYLSTLLRCDMCMSHHYPNHQKLRILYEDIEKDIKSLILSVITDSRSFKTIEQFYSFCDKIDVHRDMLDRIIQVDKEKKDSRSE